MPFIIKMMGKKEIQKISKTLNMPEEELKKILKETLDAVSKPTLNNIDCPQHYEIGISSSDNKD